MPLNPNTELPGYALRCLPAEVETSASRCCCHGATMNTSASAHASVNRAQLSRLAVKQWRVFGNVLGGPA